MDLQDYIENVLSWENRDTEKSIENMRLFLNSTEDNTYDNIVLIHKCKFLLDLEINDDTYDKNYRTKWYIYSLIKSLLETADLYVYSKLLNFLDLYFGGWRRKEVRLESFLTKQCLIDYPPILDFFGACSGEFIIRGNYSFNKLYKRKNKKPLDINFKTGLISTELPKLIQKNADFDIFTIYEQEKYKTILKFRDSFSSDESFKVFLEYAGYNIKLTREDDDEKSETIWDISYINPDRNDKQRLWFGSSAYKNHYFWYTFVETQNNINSWLEKNPLPSETLILLDSLNNAKNSYGVLMIINPGRYCYKWNNKYSVRFNKSSTEYTLQNSPQELKNLPKTSFEVELEKILDLKNKVSRKIYFKQLRSLIMPLTILKKMKHDFHDWLSKEHVNIQQYPNLESLEEYLEDNLSMNTEKNKYNWNWQYY